jgi:hypothetical protein
MVNKKIKKFSCIKYLSIRIFNQFSEDLKNILVEKKIEIGQDLKKIYIESNVKKLFKTKKNFTFFFFFFNLLI